MSARAARSAWTSAVAVATALFLTGCGSAGTTASGGGDSATASGSMTATPVATASPTLSAAQLADRFLAFAWQANQPLLVSWSGTLTTDKVQMTSTTDLKDNGADEHATRHVTVNGRENSSEVIRVANVEYFREGDSSFMASPVSDQYEVVRGLFGNVQQLSYEGPATGGMRFSIPATGVDPSILQIALGDTDIRLTSTAFEVVLDDQANPVTASLKADVTMTGSAAGTGTATFEFQFSQVGAPVSVSAPDEYWTLFTSNRFGYRMAYPSDWFLEEASASDDIPAMDEYVQKISGVVLREIDVVRGDMPKGVTPSEVFASINSQLREVFGKEYLSRTAQTIGGLPGRIFTIHTTIQGEPVTRIGTWTIASTHYWEIELWSFSGDDAADQDLLNEFLATFEATS